MYRMGESEFMQYEVATGRLKDLRKQHAIELQQAYDGIHPTRTCFDYGQGTIYWESVNPVDYAIYLIDLKEGHARSEKWWSLRASAYREAYEKLSDEEKGLLNSVGYGQYQKRENVRKRLQELLSEIISTRPELQRKFIPLDELEDIEEADRRIENMSMKELLEDYWDLDEQINEEKLKEQCFRLYDSHDMPVARISKLLGIETARVKKYLLQRKEGLYEKQIAN